MPFNVCTRLFERRLKYVLLWHAPIAVLPCHSWIVSFAWTVSSELLVFKFYFFLIFFVSGPCSRLSWPSRQLLSAR